MIINNPLFLIPLSSGLIFILVGFIMYKFPPKRINSLYGYRTVASMKNQERWDFAQLYSSKRMMQTGLFLALSCSLGLIFQPSDTTATVLGLGVMILAMILLIQNVEAALKSKFQKKQ